MKRSTVLLSTAAVLVLSAGWVLGELTSRLKATAVPPPSVVAPPPDHGHGWFQDSLGLTPEQRKNMDAVWADVKQQMDKNGERRKAMEHDRDVAIKAMMTPEESAKYDKIFDDYHVARAELDKDRDKLIHAANDKSRALLTVDQQAKWDAMSKDMHDHRGPGGPGGPGGRHGGPATQPGAASNANIEHRTSNIEQRSEDCLPLSSLQFDVRCSPFLQSNGVARLLS